MSVEKYSLTSKTWSKVAEMYDNRFSFCACAFLDKILIFGGSTNRNKTNSSLQFDTNDCSWKEVSRMTEARSSAACVVFEERIIVSGGFNNDHTLNTVESYDVLPDRWSSMPNMVYGTYRHGLVAVKNKLFVISRGEDACEVYDSVCKKFVRIKSPEIKNYLSFLNAFSIENKVFIFQDVLPKLICYDVDKNEWSEEKCEITRNLNRFSNVKVPCL